MLSHRKGPRGRPSSLVCGRNQYTTHKTNTGARVYIIIISWMSLCITIVNRDMICVETRLRIRRVYNYDFLLKQLPSFPVHKSLEISLNNISN